MVRKQVAHTLLICIHHFFTFQNSDHCGQVHIIADLMDLFFDTLKTNPSYHITSFVVWPW